jgi:hypothetical protein
LKKYHEDLKTNSMRYFYRLNVIDLIVGIFQTWEISWLMIWRKPLGYRVESKQEAFFGFLDGIM